MKRALVTLLVLLLAASVFGAGGKVAVVLSGGGARGFAELAVFEKMEEYGIPVDMVLGTSMGALLGSLYSVGYTPGEIDALVRSYDLTNILLQAPVEDPFPLPSAFAPRRDNIFTLGFSKDGIGSSPGVLGDQKLLALLNELYANVEGITNFDQLPVPFRAVATDAISGERIVYDHGSLVTAVRSSISLPMVFAPYPQDDGSLAMDGGLTDNLPIELAKELGADFIVAMDVNALQRLTPKEMNTFSAVAIQSLVLVTQTNSFSQYEYADILLFPEVGDVGTLAFDRYEYILQKGRDICDAHDEAFRNLAKEVEAAGRTLEVKDPQRTGSYVTIAPRTVEKVVVRNRSTTTTEQAPTEANFQNFIGKSFDDQERKELTAYLDRIRVSYQLSSITYNVTMGSDSQHIVLNIEYHTFEVPQYRLTLGSWSSAGVSNNTPGGVGWFLFDAMLNLDLTSLTEKGLNVRLWFHQENASALGASVTLPFFSKGGQSFGMHSSVELKYGGLSLKTNYAYGNRYASLDQGVDIKTGANYRYADILGVDLDGGLQWVYVNQSGSHLFMPYLSVGMVMDTAREKAFTRKGIRLDVLASYGWGGEGTNRYQSRVSIRQDVVLKPEHQGLRWALSANHMRMQPELSASYVDIGGLCGIPGYSLATFRQDSLTASVSWHLRLGTIFGSPFFIVESLSGGLFNPEDPFQDSVLSSGVFSSGIDWDVGAFSGVAFETPLGNYGVGLGLSVKGKFSLVIGVYD
ncbi:MAG: patatin-like phospholipase family protein [Sphaerochaeta sp.]|jgi:NTE family protein|nr:patatin-like phospholipase family protein [Sphaerochaeta sp.]